MIIEFLEGILATVIGGVFLVLSLVLSLCGITVPIWLDPAWITVIISGIPLVYSAVKKLIRNRGIAKISSALLISIAMIASIVIGDLFAAGEVAFIMALGEILEHKTTACAKKGLKNLINLAPVKSRIIKDGREEIVDASTVSVGDIIRILPGETISVDGEIICGQTSVDQSVITGESLPVDKQVGDSVYCGTVNCFGSVDVVATKVGANSTLQKLIRMVKEAENKKAPIQRTADKWASLLVPVALILAVISGILKQDINVAVTMLVVFCPCALVLATPTAVMAAIGQATKHGVVIKSGEALEKMAEVDTVAFDKTGTLTLGKLTVSDIIPLADIEQEKLLLLTASAENRSEHPLGKAIVSYAKEQNVALCEVQEFFMVAGRGILAKVNEDNIYCGNERYIKEKGIEINASTTAILEEIGNEGKAVVITASEKELLGIIALTDTVKDSAVETLEKLTLAGIKTVLLTGDNERAASFFSQKLGISRVYSELLPEHKVETIQKLKSENSTICMVGDGVNDAPALKVADVSVAMGTVGSDIAVESADIALLGDDVSKIPYLKRLSTAAVRTIKLSISLSLLINFVAIVLSFFEILNTTTGALVHNAGAFFVILIAALLYDRKFN